MSARFDGSDQHRLRILLVPPSDWVYHPFSTRLHHIFNELSNRNSVDVLWLTSKTKEGSRRQGRVRLWPVKTRASGNMAISNVLASLSVAHTVTRILHKRNYDVVVVSNIAPALVVSLISRLRGIPCVFDYSDHLPDSASLYSKSRVTRLLIRAVVYLIVLASMRVCTSIVCSSDSLSSIVRQEFHAQRKVSIVPNGYEAGFLKSDSNRERIFGELGLSRLSGHFVVVFTGSLEDRYDFDTVLQAMQSIHERGRKVSLIIVGKSISTDFESDLRRRCSKLPFVFFAGYVQDASAISDYLHIADACIAPYKLIKTNYGITLKIMEYLASGKPVLV
ncbi:MAG TPA: glycosyltransferase, partial [Nitrososphaerales archaeon]|nr:glycosyltransferase [Nitrososphaerales archaeon]